MTRGGSTTSKRVADIAGTPRVEQIFSAIAGSRRYSVAFSLITQADVALGRGLVELLVRRAIEILEPQLGPG